MSGVSIQVSSDTMTPHLRMLLRETSARGMAGTVLGRAVANELKKHFRGKNTKPNALGGSRTNFWSRVAEAVQNPKVAGDEIHVAISHPAISQKVYGGVIRPTKAKRLAIPIHASAHGRSPRVFGDLQMIPGKKGNIILARSDGAGLQALYILVRSVNQEKDPTALPKDSAVVGAMNRAAEIMARGRLGMA